MAITTASSGLEGHGLEPEGRIFWNPTTSLLYTHALARGDATLAEGGPLVVDVEDVCIDECDRDRLTVWVSVGNEGYEDVDTDVELKLIGVMADGSERLLAETTVTDTIPAAMQLESVEFLIEPVPDQLHGVYAKVDRGNDAPDDLVTECVEDNNRDDASGPFDCTPIG